MSRTSIKIWFGSIAAFTAVLVVGCGKDVQKTGQKVDTQPALTEPEPEIWSMVPEPSASPVTNAQPLPPAEEKAPEVITPDATGLCGDPIGMLPYASVSLDSLIGHEWGSWDLVDYDVYAVATLMTAQQNQFQPQTQQAPKKGMSHVQGGQTSFQTVCQNMDMLPRGFFAWNTTLPQSISAEDGVIQSDIKLNATVVGPLSKAVLVQDISTQRPTCTRLGGMIDPKNTGLAAPGCEPVQVFRSGQNEIMVLKTVQKIDPQGNRLNLKVLARYELWGAERVTPSPSPRPTLVPAPKASSIPVVSPMPLASPTPASPVQQSKR